MTLNEIKIGQSVIISKVGGDGALRQHFLDMGVIPGAEATLEKLAPMGDPMELRIHGYELTLRLDDAAKIEVDKDTVVLEKQHEIYERTVKVHEDVHPGLGEGGVYHIKADENPLPEDTVLTFALAGNQNCGKTTLFNQLTGSNQHVGNFPGVTVDRKEGEIRGNKNTMVVDLPGIYSLSPYTNEEIVSRQYILDEKPTGIINIVDATNIERNLYLTLQLMELGIPIVLALNMMDEVRGNGGSILVNEMEAMLGIPVIPISAAKNEGIEELINHAVHIAKYQEKPGRTDFCGKDEAGGAVHRAVHGVMHLIEDHALEAQIPIRFAATKLIEGDEIVKEKLALSENEQEMVEHIVSQMEEERGLDRAAAIADMRFEFIQKLCAETVIRPKESKERERSRKMDKILTGKWTAIPSFILIMALVFWLTFDVIGGWLQGLFETGIDWFTETVNNVLVAGRVSEILRSLIIDGAITGVGAVISFLPIIVILFLFLSLLEDSGYMARIAFVMDKLLRKIGLSGRSIVPMLIGFGCSVPAIMATRTLPSERDRKMTIMMTPFMSCTAKLPIYGFFTVTFFPNHAGLIMVGLYFLGIIVGILCALLYKGTLFKGEAVPFVMELPNYRMPGTKNVAHLLWDKTKDFCERAFTVIFLASLAVWLLQSFDFGFNPVSDPSASMLAVTSGVIAKVFTPLGLNDWRITTALVTGIIAKESVVSTLIVLFGSETAVLTVLTSGAAAALLAFCVIYTQCIAAIAATGRELGKKWTVGIAIWQCIAAWIVAFLVKMILLAFGIA